MRIYFLFQMIAKNADVCTPTVKAFNKVNLSNLHSPICQKVLLKFKFELNIVKKWRKVTALICCSC